MADAPDARDSNADPANGTKTNRRKFILCFDGTGNKFLGNAGDSNILKIYSMLDKTDGTQFHYYQPGIGTYTTRATLSSNGVVSRVASWYNKAKDSAVGATVDEHVMAGYRFLMRYYQMGDDIYFFGFSRGAYIARFLAEMLDHVGLLTAGNEELVRFVWKTFAKWQRRQGAENEEEKKVAGDMLKFMVAFRETFSRPVRRIRFLGLFDTVNSVSKFESAWMSRSSGKFPYTARSSAIMIRHAVAIDERRAKFRQDLTSQRKEPHSHHSSTNGPNATNGNTTNGQKVEDASGRFRRPSTTKLLQTPRPDRFRSRSRGRSRSKEKTGKDGNTYTAAWGKSTFPGSVPLRDDDDCDSEDEDEAIEQDIEELWFPGGHADIGGGWPPDEPEKLALSHGPLVWMVREAQKAGLSFIPEKMKALNCLYVDESKTIESVDPIHVPIIELNDDVITSVQDSPDNGPARAKDNELFLQTLQSSCARGRIHDCLAFKQGIPSSSVISWKIMEYMPFRRMDLQKDGTWKAIRWPLPMGEVRDVPDDVKIHNSVMRRMEADPNYRPGNLIVGGGGRGQRKAPEHMGMGDWVVLRGEGHPVEEVWVKRKYAESKKGKSEVNWRYNGMMKDIN